MGENQNTGEESQSVDPDEVVQVLRRTLYEDHNLRPALVLGILRRLEAEAEAEMEGWAKRRVNARIDATSEASSQSSSTDRPEYIR